MKLAVRQCTAEDIDTLRRLAYKTYDETFAPMNASSIMKAYLEQAFGAEKLRCELADRNSAFYFLYADGILAGYLKLNEAPAQTDINDIDSLEIERIYVAGEFQGMGLGRALMDYAVDIARKRGKAYLWLGVWERNDKAIAFYRKNGFYETGTHSFFMGDEEQTDYVMRRDL